MLFDTGIKRRSSSILKGQKEAYGKKKFKSTSNLLKLLPDFKDNLVKGNLKIVGEILNEGWKIKRSIVSGITNENIDDLYKAAINAGARGGKLCGAGGGGFLMFYVDEKSKKAVRSKLSGLRELNFNFDYEGAVLL